MEPTSFESLYRLHRAVLERFVHYKVTNRPDAEDVLQEVLADAYAGFPQLRDAGRFKSWLLGIAWRKCADYYRKKACRLDIPLQTLPELELDAHGQRTASLIQDTLDQLPNADHRMLYLFYLCGMPQQEIAMRLSLPLGTVKSRMHAAKQRFAMTYPYPPKGGIPMSSNEFPRTLPMLDIRPIELPAFPVQLEEISGWFIVPRLGDTQRFAFYDEPDGRLTGINALRCTQNAEIHGVHCVQVEIDEADELGSHTQRTLFLRRTETHTAYVAEMTLRRGTLYLGTFLDEEWLQRYGIGENNIGREIHQAPKGIAQWMPDGTIQVTREDCTDIIGRYAVDLGARTFDTVALLELYECGSMLTLSYIGQDGRMVLFRRYNRYDWKRDHYRTLWTDKLPHSERLTINGSTYVHWYDCIPETVL